MYLNIAVIAQPVHLFDVKSQTDKVQQSVSTGPWYVEKQPVQRGTGEHIKPEK